MVTVDAFTKNGRTYKAASELTDNSGMAESSEFEFGQRTITVSGNGIVTHTFGPYNFEKAKILTLSLTCQPQFNNIPAATPAEQKEEAQK